MTKFVLLAIYVNFYNRRYAVFFDIGVGLVLTTLVGVATNSEPSWTLLCVGLLGALWPDIDFIIWILRGKKVDHLAHQHRDLLHRPLILTPILTIAVWLWLGRQAGILFGIATLAHFTHDTIGHGWGIKWLWPLDNRYWCYRSCGDHPIQMHAWTKYEQDLMCEDYGNRHWMKQSYGSWSGGIILELMVMGLGMASVVGWYLVVRT